MTQPKAQPRPTRAGPLALGDLLDTDQAAVVTGVSIDSRRVLPGDLYVALPGRATHGARFAAAAVAAGASAILTDAAGADLAGDAGVPVVVVTDPRSELARVAAQAYGRPADHLLMLGVTGTAGKTSTAFLLEAGLAAAGLAAATIGTLGFRLRGEELPADRSTITTPEAPDLQALLAVMRERGAQAVAMEVSSHALALNRADQITFDVAGFTNLGHDHLDFHHDQESYYRAKASLFLAGRSRIAVVNTDDPWGRRLAADLRAEGRARVVTTGSDPGSDYRITASTAMADGGTRLQVATPSGGVEFVLGLIGDFNAANALTAAAMLDQAGIDLAAALPGLATATVPGRMQRVPLPGDAPQVVVDFAHTSESVAAALAALPAGRRVVVLGCGGDRDIAKREPMGHAAALGAAVVVVTDDNPRSEDPAAIRAAVLAGARRAAAGSGAQVVDGGDRRSAIRTALHSAGPGEWVAILGKGHERGQEVAGVVTPFDDVAVAVQEWQALAGPTPGSGRDE